MEENTEKKHKGAISDDNENAYRILNIISYFIILVILGVPVWWYTTRVYRATLPMSEMNEFMIANKSDKKLSIPLSVEYDVLVTIVHPEPQNLNVELNGQEIEDNLQIFLKDVSSVANFVVKSQWLYLMELGIIPRKVIDHYAINEDQLPHVITPLEKKLWSHLSPRPCLNLVLYISHCNVPLYIYNNQNEKIQSNAYLSPRWGGIFILNPDSRSCGHNYYKPDLQKVASTFITLLKKMLEMEELSDGSLAALHRRKAEEMINSTRRTLRSLAQLLSEISSIVISDDVADKIKIAVESADQADYFLNENQVEEALEHSKLAFINSEAAFSHPSLLALLYFPDDQKYAVYIPLFLPVMIPVLMSLVTVRKWLSKQRQLKIKDD